MKLSLTLNHAFSAVLRVFFSFSLKNLITKSMILCRFHSGQTTCIVWTFIIILKSKIIDWIYLISTELIYLNDKWLMHTKKVNKDGMVRDYIFSRDALSSRCYFWWWSDSAVDLHTSEKILGRTRNLVENWFMTVKMNFTRAPKQCSSFPMHITFFFVFSCV